jgi:D-serine deaminase-like pyridoxal phosphate-dependent protein
MADSLRTPPDALDTPDTPFLWVDLDQLEANIAELSRYFGEAGVQWRPHTKGIKVPEIAQMAVSSGAIGVTCAKLGEAEVMAAAGIKDILIANQVVGPRKISRLADLQHRAKVKVAVDSAENAAELSAEAVRRGVEIGVVVEVDVGMGRAGVPSGKPAVELSELLAGARGLEYLGLMGWEGHTVGIEDPEEKQAAVRRAVGLLDESVHGCREAGLPVRIVSGGGSGDYTISAHLGTLTEIQAGGAIFCDATYASWGATTRPSLFVRTMVTSRPAPDRIVFDAGFKALPAHRQPPIGLDLPAAQPYIASAEHGKLILDRPDHSIKPGDTADFIVGYGDMTVFLHDNLYGLRNNLVEKIWEIEGRGKLA